MPPAPEHRVLPTLNEDGSRRRIRPKLYQGELYRRRQLVGYGLLAMFALLPFLRVQGRPLVLLDVAHREFTLAGRVFLATDGVLLMLLMLTLFVGIIWLSALLGRAWCGWGCPQTVYMELLFRPLERLIERGRSGQLRLDERGGGLRRAVKNVVFLGLSFAVANVFLAYFVGAEVLGRWLCASPLDSPGGFLVMGVTGLLVFFDFAYFREQMCTAVCPYARLQSALLDRDSLIIGYDAKRGEPRHKGKLRPDDGDCVDCSACVVTCPTGIDIREGLQLECIACGQCVDACNSVMPKVGRPLGLIRYASQRSLAEGARRILRPRVLLYSALLAGLIFALIVVAASRRGAEVTILRGIGAPFVLRADDVQNQLRVKVEDHSGHGGTYRLQLLAEVGGRRVPLEELGARVISAENPLHLPAMGRATAGVFVIGQKRLFQRGKLPIWVRVTEPNGVVQDAKYQLLGPEE